MVTPSGLEIFYYFVELNYNSVFSMSDAGEMMLSELPETNISQSTYRQCMLPSSPSRKIITQREIFVFRYISMFI